MQFNRDWLEQVMAVKGLRFDIFNPFNTAINAIDEDIEKQLEAGKAMAANLKELVNDGCYYNPVDTYDLEKLKEAKITSFVKIIMHEMKKRFVNLTMDAVDVDRFVKQTFGKEKQPFNVYVVLYYIFEKYYDQEDIITLAQMQKNIKDIVPYLPDPVDKWSAHPAKSAEEVFKFKETGIELHDASGRQAEAVMQFAQVVLGGVKPSEAKKWNRLGDSSDSIKTDEIKSMHIYKNGRVPVVFKTKVDMETFCKALYMTPEEILSAR